MAAITWQNINGPSLAEAGRPMEAAQRSFDAAFTGFGDILKRREATQTANWDQTKLNNTNALLGAVQEAKTPEEFAAQEATLRQQLLGYGAQVDATAGRNALDGRLATLQQRVTTGQQFKDQQTDILGRPIAAGYQSALAQATTPDAVRSLMESIQTATGAGAVDPRLASTLTDKALSRSQALVTEDRAAKKFGFDEDKNRRENAAAPADIAYKQALTRSANVQANAAGIQSRVAEAALQDRRAASDAAKMTAAFQARLKGSTYEGGVYTPSDSVELSEILSKNTGLDGGEQSRIIDRINKLASEGIPVSVRNGDKTDVRRLPIPKSLIKGIVAGARDDENITAFWNWNEAGANFVERRLREALQATDTYPDFEGKPIVRMPAVDGYDLLLGAQQNAIDNPSASGSGDKPPKPKKY